MPVKATVFRSRCGCFHSIFINFMLRRSLAAKRKTTLRLSTMAGGVAVSLLLLQFFFMDLLQLCGDVEKNPGPPKTDSMRQTRLSTSGAKDGKDTGNASKQSPAPDPSLKDIAEHLAKMESRLNSKMDTLDTNIDERLTALREEVGDAYAKVQEEVRELREEVSGLRQENQELRDRLNDMEVKTDDLECRSRRNNVLFYGLKKGDGEQGTEGCERTVKDFLRDKLGMTETVVFDRVHRTSTKPNAPIIARCAFYKDRVQILKAKSKLRGSNIFLGEDFSSRVRDIRKKLSPHLKLAREQGKRATMIYDHLLIDGEKFVLTADGSGIVEVEQRRVA